MRTNNCYSYVYAVLLLLGFAVTAGAQMLPYQNPSLSFHDRAVDLVSRLSLEEKASQLGNNVDRDINRADYSGTGRVVLPSYQYWNEALHGVARSGAATSFPESKSMSATWDRQLIYDCASAISDEARIYNNVYKKGLNYWCPTINMSRDPRWGRDEENYGEDPFLAGQLAVQFIKGMQGEQTAENPYFKTIACAKHFAANNYEQGRQGSTSFVSERMLREYYLPAFEMCVKEGDVRSIMSSYNALSTDINEKNAAGIGFGDPGARGKVYGGKPNAMNDWLLTSILRDEWGFKGYVTSDCAGVSCIYRYVKHFYFGNNYGTYTDDAGDINDMYMAVSTAASIKAGNDINCEFMNRTSVFQTAVQQAVEDGLLTVEELDRALVRVLETRFALGEFDDSCPWRNVPASKLECEEHQQLALKAAQESIVLLKNEKTTTNYTNFTNAEGIASEGENESGNNDNGSDNGDGKLLPLTTDKSIALIGPYADAIMLGDYSGTPTHTTTPFQAVAKKMNFSLSDGTYKFNAYDRLGYAKRGETKFKGADVVENTASGDWMVFEEIDFGAGCSSLTINCSTKNGSGEGTVNFYLDADDASVGSLTEADAAVSVSNSSIAAGGWTTYKDITVSLDPAQFKGKHKVTVKFIGTQSYVGNWKTFRFYNEGAEPLETQGPLYMLTTSGGVNEKASAEMIQRAVAVAQRADVVVFLGGTDYSKPDDHATGTESHDRFIITLPGNQEELLKAIYEVNKNVVLVLESNSSLDITWAKENVPAIMAAWYGGQAQGQAICDVLFGDVNPSGKLTSTWYNNLGELPRESDSKFKNNGMLEYDIDQWGYTYMYYGRGTGGNVARQAEKPMYPFGYGLSYTTFEYSNWNVNGNDNSSIFNLQCSIRNTGTRKGAEVVQVYASFPGSSVSHRPTRKLVGFERVELEPGETKTVTIPVREKELAYYDEGTHTWQVEGGTVKLSIGSSSDDERLSTTVTTTAHKLADTYLSDSGTGIKNVNGNDNGNDNVNGNANGNFNGNNGQWSTVYDLNGTPVGTASKMQSLPKGIYIVNGQKQTN